MLRETLRKIKKNLLFFLKKKMLQTSIQSSWLYSRLPSKSAVSCDGSTILDKPSKETITVCRREGMWD